jgi:tetratricopeptide (TPR) repeat protein
MESLDERRIRALLEQSERARAARDGPEAMRLLLEARNISPGHPLVLNAAGVLALGEGHAAEARDLFNRALAAGKAAPLYVNLAAALRQLNCLDEEAQALESALALEPRNLLALLGKAALTERRGEKRKAAAIYANALRTLHPGQSLPEHLRPAITAARQAVADNTRELERHLHAALAKSRAGQDTSPRFELALDALMGRRRIYHPQPTQLHFPQLPALEFYPRDLFSWLPTLESATAVVRAEFERVFVEDQDRLEPYIAYPDGVPLDQWRELNHSRRWSAFYLWRDGRPMDENLARCPRTAALLASLPRHDVPRHAPTAFFSILAAHTKIPAHTGVTNTRVIVHLPLVLPGQCRFRVGSETREWRMGEAWIFDDTIEHEAWNDSDHPRAILIFDVWNPFIEEHERTLIREAVPAIADFYGSSSLGDDVGGI